MENVARPRLPCCGYAWTKKKSWREIFIYAKYLPLSFQKFHHKTSKMKKALLLMAAGAAIMTANAQQMQRSSVMFGGSGANQTAQKGAAPATHPNFHTGSTATAGDRTTSTGGGRWYSYTGYIIDQLGSTNVGAYIWSLWNDTTGIYGYSDGTAAYNEWTSMGMSLDPFFSGFNDPSVYPGEIEVTSSDSYTIDSIAVAGVYSRNPSNTNNDQLRFGLVYGDGTSTSDLPAYYFTGMTADYGTDTLTFIDLLHDSTNNQAQGSTLVTTNISLGVADTSSNFLAAFAVNPLVVPPASTSGANFAAASVGFKNGTAGYPLNDTVQGVAGTMYYNDFFMQVLYEGTSSAIAFPTYSISDQDNGYFKREGAMDGGWGGYYIPNWAWTASGGASALQYPTVDFHVTCATCNPLGLKDVNKAGVIAVKAYPNPTSGVLNIGFRYSNASDVTATITDMLGNVVATQTIKNVANGNATFNTQTLAAGVYMYTVQTASGNRNTGRVVVAH
jgi:Secretion system C-terminal sorting domain